MANRNSALSRKRKQLIAEGKHEEAEQMKKKVKESNRLLKAMQRDKKRKIKAGHKKSGYYEKAPFITVASGTMSRK